jgi:hypothetical protein
MFVCCTASPAISQGKGGRDSLEKKKMDEKIIDITKKINASITKYDIKKCKSH